jgi:putative salt-induced outer membrane protein YdiY
MMNARFRLLTLVLLIAMPLYARDKTDVMVMTNGDRLTCEVKGLDAGVLYVSFDYIDGTALVDWSKVVRLESKQLFLVKTVNGAIYKGQLRTPGTPADRPVKIQVLAAEKEAVLDRTQIVNMIATSESFWQRFNGELSFGTIYSKGNQSTQYTLSSETVYVRERWSALAGFESSLSSSSGTNASTRNSLILAARRLLPRNNWYYTGVVALLQSSEQGIARQTTVGGGIGRYLKNTNSTNISLAFGPAFVNTNYKQSAFPVNNQKLAAAIFFGQAQFFKFSKTNLDVTGTVLPVLSDAGRFHFNTDASYYIKIISNLKWNMSFYGNWDNRPPLGFSGSDYGTSSGLSWTFGLK